MTALDTVKAFLDAVAVKDFDAALQHVTPSCEYHNMMMDKAIGPRDIREQLEPFFEPTLENELTILNSMSDGNTVFVERLDRHLMDYGWAELPVTGVWEVEDGQIRSVREYFDLQTLMRQIPA